MRIILAFAFYFSAKVATFLHYSHMKSKIQKKKKKKNKLIVARTDEAESNKKHIFDLHFFLLNLKSYKSQ